MSVELADGTEIAGRYRLSRLIGEGGMGEVWAADDQQSGELVALKFVKEAKASSRLRRRLLREAKAACAVRHPSVVGVHDIIELEDGSPVMVMELLEGESLADRLRRDGEMPVAELADIMLPVVSAVGTAHAHGVVHRDLKPENVFLARDDGGEVAVKILDFGIAKLAPSEYEAAQSTELTRTGSILGTPCYMAPEQVFGEKDIDHRADIWALGMILYEALSGILPTRAENMGQVMKIITTRAIWPLEQAAPDLPKEITELVDRMLSRSREQRPQDLREVAALLSGYTDVEAPEFDEPVAPSSRFDDADTVPSDRLALGHDADPLAETAAETPKAIGAGAGAMTADPAETQSSLVKGKTSLASQAGRAASRSWRYALVVVAIGAGGMTWWLWPKPASELETEQAAQPSGSAALPSSGEDERAGAGADERHALDLGPTEQSSTEDAGAGGSSPDAAVPSRVAGHAPRAQPTRLVRGTGATPTATAPETAAPTAEGTATPKAEPPEQPESHGGVVDTLPF